MKKTHSRSTEMQAEYDFSRGTRGKYSRRFAAGSNVIVLDPDVAKVFSSSVAVNRSLRKLARLTKRGRCTAPQTVIRERPAKKYGK